MTDTDNQVKLLLDGSEFANWKTCEITSELNTLARAFTVSVTTKIPDGRKVLEFFRPGKAVQVQIGQDVVLTGWIDKTPASYTATDVTVAIEGRSKTEDLIDCCPVPAGETISFDDGRWPAHLQAPTTGTLISCPGTTATEWKEQATDAIIAHLAGGYGVRFYSEVNLKDKQNFTITPTDKILDALKTLTKGKDIVFTDDANGNLVAVKKASTEAAKTVKTPLVLGSVNLSGVTVDGNILRGQASFDGTKLFSQYQVIGQPKGTTSAHGSKLNSKPATKSGIYDIGRRRITCEKAKGQAGASDCSKEADGNQKFAENEFFKTTYTVQGWRDTDGKLWRVNTLVRLQDELLHYAEYGKSDGTLYLITRVKFSLSNDAGMTTELEVVPPDGYRIQQDTAATNAQQKGKVNTSKQQSSGGMKLERNRFSNSYG